MYVGKLQASVSIFISAAFLAGCVYEKGFEYQSRAALVPLNASGVKGSIVIGYGIHSSAYRFRIVASGLSKDTDYEVQFFEETGCEDAEFKQSHRIDGSSSIQNKRKEAWGFDAERTFSADTIWGSVEKEFALTPPSAPSIYSTGPEKYPTVVVYALAKQADGKVAIERSVACGTISSPPENRRPHT